MDLFDLLVIGGGINGAGIARDAAGRGLSVLLCEKDDLGAGHLVALRQAGPWRPALPRILRVPPGARGADRARGAAARRAAHHLADALRAAAQRRSMRPAWLVRARPVPLRPSRRPQAAAGDPRRSTCARAPEGAPLKAEYRAGFEYSDCWVDDARLVVLNALDAARARRRGPDPHAPASARRARRRRCGRSTMRGPRDGRSARSCARARWSTPPGPGSSDVLGAAWPARTRRGSVRLVKGSHIIVPQVLGGAAGLSAAEPRQARDLRQPLRGRLLALIGTTDIPYRGPADEVAARTRARSTTCWRWSTATSRSQLRRERRRSSYSGVRPLYDDKAEQSLGGHARLHVRRRRAAAGRARRCSPSSAARSPPSASWPSTRSARLRPFLPAMGPAWTAAAPLPGGDMPGADFEGWLRRFQRQRPWLPRRWPGTTPPLRHPRRRAAGRCRQPRGARPPFRRPAVRARGPLPARRGVGADRRRHPGPAAPSTTSTSPRPSAAPSPPGSPPSPRRGSPTRQGEACTRQAIDLTCPLPPSAGPRPAPLRPPPGTSPAPA